MRIFADIANAIESRAEHGRILVFYIFRGDLNNLSRNITQPARDIMVNKSITTTKGINVTATQLG